MDRLEYHVEPTDDGWMVRVGGRPFGPYKAMIDAFKTACVGAGRAFRAIPVGRSSEVIVWLEGTARPAWSSEFDGIPIDYRGRLAALCAHSAPCLPGG